MHPQNSWLPSPTGPAQGRQKPRWAKAHRDSIERSYNICLNAQANLGNTILFTKEYYQAKVELDSQIRRLFQQVAAAKKRQSQVPAHGFGLQWYVSTYWTLLLFVLSTLLLLLGVALEWTKEYTASVTKPLQVRWAGIGCKLVELFLGVAYWSAFGKGGPKFILYLTKGIVTALEIPIKGLLVAKFVPKTTLTTCTDWFNLMGPSILALSIAAMDTVQLILASRGGDNRGENNNFLPFTKSTDRYSALAKSPYPGTGLDRAEKLVLIEALLWTPENRNSSKSGAVSA